MRSIILSALLAVAGCTSASPPAVSVERGHYLATSLGCTSCHGPQMDGHKVFDKPDMAVLYSSNVSRLAAGYTNAELEHVIRAGQRPDGSRLWFMDAAPYAILSRPDTTALIAWLRSLPPVGENHPRLKAGPRFAAAVKTGQAAPESATLAADLAHPAIDLGPKYAAGRYLARTRCGVCHAPDLSGGQIRARATRLI